MRFLSANRTYVSYYAITSSCQKVNTTCAFLIPNGICLLNLQTSKKFQFII